MSAGLDHVVAGLRAQAIAAAGQVNSRDARRRRRISEWVAVRDEHRAAGNAMTGRQPLKMMAEALATAAAFRAMAWAALCNGTANHARAHRAQANAYQAAAAQIGRTCFGRGKQL